MTTTEVQPVLMRIIGLEEGEDPWLGGGGGKLSFLFEKDTRRSQELKRSLAEVGLCAKPVLVPGQGVQHYLREYVKHHVFKTPSVLKHKYACFANRIIAVTGIIGIGKTTALKKIASFLNSIGVRAVAVEETMNDSLLRQFYAFMAEHPNEPNAYALTLQIDMLNRCLRAYQNAALSTGRGTNAPEGTPTAIPSGICWIIDGSLHSNVVFAALHASMGNMSEMDWQSYLKSALSMGSFDIDHVLHLWGKPTLAKERIEKRDRDFEKAMPLDYLKQLNQGYTLSIKEQAAAGHSRITVFDNTIDHVPAEAYLDALLDERRVVPSSGVLGVCEAEDDYPTTTTEHLR